MTTHYKLQNSNVTSGYTASVNHVATVEHKAIFDRMEKMQLTISKKQAEAVVDKYFQAIYAYLLDGFKIRTPYFRIGLSIKGVFDTTDDTFDPNRHKVNMNFNSGTESRKRVLPYVKFKKEVGTLRRPILNSYLDRRANSTNNIITPNGLAELSGSYLDFKDTDDKQGIFFIAADNTETKVDPLDVIQNPSSVGFKNPNTLGPGSYRLVIRRAFGKSMREGALGYILMVQA